MLMPRNPLIAIADDLTGAAEIAAFGFRHGLDSVVVTDTNTTAGGAELIVYDTDSRLDEPRVAAEKLSALGRALASRPRELLYKKTDSVLRGGVRAEVEALASALGLPRVLLLPANPTLGRRIRDGRYTVDGTPLHQTTFAHDPHHPAKSDSVRDLLGAAGSLAVAVQNSADSLPKAGLVVCNAATAGDVHAWAQHVAAGDLPAGGGEFFSALLGHRGLKPSGPSADFSPGTPTLIVSGTTSSAGALLRANARRDGLTILPMPGSIAKLHSDATAALSEWINAVHARLIESRAAVVVFDGPVVSGADVAAAIRGAFALCVRELVQRGALQHVIVEGGATSAAIARELGWRELRMVHEWAHGVASLRPGNQPAITLTMKPGSYGWPDALWQRILRSGSRVSLAVREKTLS
jgi:uncharacterized protein YgbK (DUF1537 family)